MKKKKIGLGAILLIVLVLITQDAFSQNNNASLSNQEVRARITFIETSLEEGQTMANAWYWSWVGIYGALTATNLALFFTPETLNPDHPNYARQDMMTGAITSLLGVFSLIIDPMVPGYALDRFSSMADGTPEERLAKLERAEFWFRRSAQREMDGRSWLAHSLNFVVNLAAGLTIWLGFNRSIVDGLIAFLPGLAIGEIQIWTQPTRAIDELRRYERRNSIGYNPEDEDNTEYSIAIVPGGFVATLRF